jgi:mRNA interferase MazF
VPFPFTDLSAVKQRPALILSPKRLNNVRNDLIVAAISSQIPNAIGEDEILLSAADQRTAGLPKASIIKLGKIFTIHQGLIRKKLGCVPDSTLESILQKLMRSMQ